MANNWSPTANAGSRLRGEGSRIVESDLLSRKRKIPKRQKAGAYGMREKAKSLRKEKSGMGRLSKLRRKCERGKVHASQHHQSPCRRQRVS